MNRTFLAVSLGLLLIAPNAPSFATDQGKPSKSSLAPAVTVVNAATREMIETVVVTGTLVPRDEVLVNAEIDGYRLTEVLVEEGMRVERGQLLARLSRDLIERQIAQQNALVDKAMAAVPQAENNIAQAEAAETEARLGFERARIDRDVHGSLRMGRFRLMRSGAAIRPPRRGSRARPRAP
jgi:multidrug efflux pump subunit AcrA (membrane-fusion protein)